MRVILKAFVDRSFSFVVKPPPTSYFIKKAAGLPKASQRPGHESAGRVSVKYIYEISKLKQKSDSDLIEHDLEGICSTIVAQCKSMGIEVVEDTLPPAPLRIDL